jgi:hypothetical protein
MFAYSPRRERMSLPNSIVLMSITNDLRFRLLRLHGLGRALEPLYHLAVADEIELFAEILDSFGAVGMILKLRGRQSCGLDKALNLGIGFGTTR